MVANASAGVSVLRSLATPIPTPTPSPSPTPTPTATPTETPIPTPIPTPDPTENGDERTLDATVPTMLSLQLGPSTTFGALIPGLARDYQTAIAGNAIVSTDGARLTIADPSATAPGHLINGAAVLPLAVQARADSLDGTVGPFADVGGGSTAPPHW